MKYSAYAFAITAIAILALVAGPALAADSVFGPDRASKLIGAQAIDAEGQPLGTVHDLVIAEDDMLSYVVIAKSDNSGYVALPFEAARPQVNPDGDVVLAVAKDDFDRAATFASSSNMPMQSSGDEARAYRSAADSACDCPDAWNPSDFKQVNGISTLNPYIF